MKETPWLSQMCWAEQVCPNREQRLKSPCSNHPGPGEGLTRGTVHVQEVADVPLHRTPRQPANPTNLAPRLLALLAFSLLFSPPDVNSWCNPRNNMGKFLACYFWQLLPPREEGDYTAGYSGELARRPQICFLARTPLMINPGQAEQTVSTSEHVWKGQCHARQPAYRFRRCCLFIKYIKRAEIELCGGHGDQG